jgi:hypothetical protein
MGIAYRFTPDGRGVLVVWDGTVTLNDWRDHLRSMLADPAYRAAKAQLADVRFVSLDQSFTDEGIRETISRIGSQRAQVAGMQLAILAGRHWSKAKLVESALRPLSVAPIVFNDTRTAFAWLGLDPADASAMIDELRQGLTKSE